MSRVDARSLIGRAVDLLASRTLSFWVMGAWIALATVWLIPFQVTGQPDATIQGIARHWLPFRMVYAALLVTTLVCALVRLRKDWRRANFVTPADRPLPSTSSAVVGETGLDDVASRLEGMHYEVRRFPDRVLAVRHRWSVLGGSVFHLALPMLALGFLVHALTFSSINFRLVEGQSTDQVLRSVTSGKGAWKPLRSSVESIALEQVQPRYFKDVLLFDRLDAQVRFQRTGTSRGLSLASPLWVDPFTMISIQDFGVAPRFQILRANKIEDDIIADMSIFPPGNEDSADLPKTGYTVSAMLYPDYSVVNGQDVSLSYNLRNPRLRVALEQANKPGVIVTRRLVRVGERVPATQDTFVVKELRYYGEFRVWRSYGFPLVVLSALLILGGLVMRFLLPRQDLVAWTSPDGVALLARVDGASPTGARWATQRLAVRLAEEPSTRPRGPKPLRDDSPFASPDEDAFSHERDEE